MYLVDYRALLMEYRALVIKYTARLIEYSSRLVDYRALLIEYKAPLAGVKQGTHLSISKHTNSNTPIFLHTHTRAQEKSTYPAERKKYCKYVRHTHSKGW